MPKVSIIVPVYNTKDYLHRCVDSILAQTFTDFELLLIDDGSTDSSGIICDNYSQIDSRVRVFHKKNGGVSSARNIGLDNANGEWITFVDSDDWVAAAYIEKLYEKTDHVDLLMSYAKCYNQQGEIKQKKYLERYINSEDIGILFLEHDLGWQTSPWAKFFKKDIIDELRFVEGMHIGEDMVFLYTYIMRCTRFFVSPVDNYNYDMSRENTLTRRVAPLSEERFAYNKVQSILTDFTAYYSIVDIEVLRKIDWIRFYYTDRLINSLYHTMGLSRCERLNYIASLDIELYVSFYSWNSIKERILYLLMKNKLFNIYDFLRKLAVVFRR